MQEGPVPGVGDLVEIGRGRTAVVHRSTLIATGRPVAVKILAATTLDAAQQTRFEREGTAVAGLAAHPNIAAVHEVGATPDGHPYLVTELLPRCLDDLLTAQGALRWQEAVALGTEIAAGLTAAHRAGVLHRDVNPRNVLLADGDVPKLADFGLARFATALDREAPADPALFAHAAPELVQGRPVDERSDVYSLAATLYGAVAGTPAFVRRGEDRSTGLQPILDRIVTETPAPLTERGVPVGVDAVILAGMAKDPAKRPPTPELFAQQLLAAAKSAEESTGAITRPIVAAAASAAARAAAPDATRQMAATAPTRAMPATGEPGHGRAPLERRAARRTRMWPSLLGLVAIAALVIGGLAWLVGRSDDDDAGTTTAPIVPLDTTDTETSSTEPATTGTRTPTTAEPVATTRPATTAVPSTTAETTTTVEGVTTVPGEFSIVRVTTDADSLELHIPSDGTRTYFTYDVEVANLTADTYCPVRGGTNEVEGPGLGAVELGGCFPDDDGEPNQFMFRAFAPGRTTFILYMCNGESNGGTCPEGTKSVNGIEITVVADDAED